MVTNRHRKRRRRAEGDRGNQRHRLDSGFSGDRNRYRREKRDSSAVGHKFGNDNRGEQKNRDYYERAGCAVQIAQAVSDNRRNSNLFERRAERERTGEQKNDTQIYRSVKFSKPQALRQNQHGATRDRRRDNRHKTRNDERHQAEKGQQGNQNFTRRLFRARHVADNQKTLTLRQCFESFGRSLDDQHVACVQGRRRRSAPRRAA